MGQISITKSRPAEVNGLLEADSSLLCLLKPKEGERLAESPTARAGGHQMAL